MTEKTEVNILDLGKCFSYLNSLGDDQVYLTPQGIGLMEGMILTNPEVEVVSQEKHIFTEDNLLQTISDRDVQIDKMRLEQENNTKLKNEYLTKLHDEVNRLKERNKELYSKLYFWQK